MMRGFTCCSSRFSSLPRSSRSRVDSRLFRLSERGSKSSRPLTICASTSPTCLLSSNAGVGSTGLGGVAALNRKGVACTGTISGDIPLQPRQRRGYAKKKLKGGGGKPKKGGGSGRNDGGGDGGGGDAAYEALDAIKEEMGELLAATVEHLRETYANLSIGRASPGLLQGVRLKDGTPLDSIADVYVKDPRTLMVVFYDDSDRKEAEKAIAEGVREFDLGVHSHVDGLKVTLPLVTQEYRQKMAESVANEAMKSKTVIRNNRQKVMVKLKPLKKKLPKDDAFAAEKDLQQLVDKFSAECDTLRDRKVKDINRS